MTDRKLTLCMMSNVHEGGLDIKVLADGDRREIHIFPAGTLTPTLVLVLDATEAQFLSSVLKP